MTRNIVSSEDTATSAFTAEQRAAVLAELELILSDPIFKTSNRCVALLRYVVVRTLDSGKDGFKERLLGMEVFGRSADYDVAADPIVRRVANEIRKRLAQYYQEPGNDRHVRIRLDRGGYLPEFEFVREHRETEPIGPRPVAGIPEQREDPKPIRDVPELRELLSTDRQIASGSAGHTLRRRWLFGIAAGMFVIASFVFLLRLAPSRSPEYKVWKPLLDSSDTIIVALPIRTPADQSGTAALPATIPTPEDRTSSAVPLDPNPSTLFRDVYAGTSITTQLSRLKKDASLRPSTGLTYRDFQQNPAVLIGGLNNPWVGTFLSNLRFTVQYDPVTRDAWVQDSQNPLRRDWKIEGKLQSEDRPADYAIITRVFNRETSQWLLALSGLEAKGTEAAAELVADPKFANLIPAAVSGRGNFQIVVKTSVIGGEPGPLQVVAVQTW